MGTSRHGDGAASVLGLVIHPTRPVAGSVTTIVDWARRHAVDVIARAVESDRVAGVDAVPDEEFVNRVDGVVSLGGDGTMLAALRLVIARPVPVLGVNHGNLGFLIEITPVELEGALARLVSGEFTIEDHACLAASSTGTVELVPSVGFNDIVLGRLGRSGTTSIDLSVGGQQYGYYNCDSLIVSTPTGSTAYNYAAGGPVVSPSASAIVITPVAPMAGITRSVILGPGDEVTLHVATDSAEAGVEVDGTRSAVLDPEGALSVRLREGAGKVVRLAAEAHGKRARIKLSLLDLPLRRDQLLDLIPEGLRRRA
ncbi:MAG: NAD(+)/NADH kinase [Streptosporangiales bacterium]